MSLYYKADGFFPEKEKLQLKTLVLILTLVTVSLDRQEAAKEKLVNVFLTSRLDYCGVSLVTDSIMWDHIEAQKCK